MKELDGKQTLVTGAATETGRAIVQSFTEKGARVIAVDTTDDAVEQAIEELGLAEADEVITRGLDDSDLGSWWDLSNLIAAFYHNLDVFVHIPQGQPSESLPIAVDRLKQSLIHADQAVPGGVSVVVVSSGADETVRQVASQLTEEASRIRLSALVPSAPIDTAKAVVERVSIHTDSSKGVRHE